MIEILHDPFCAKTLRITVVEKTCYIYTHTYVHLCVYHMRPWHDYIITRVVLRRSSCEDYPGEGLKDLVAQYPVALFTPVLVARP